MSVIETVREKDTPTIRPIICTHNTGERDVYIYI